MNNMLIFIQMRGIGINQEMSHLKTTCLVSVLFPGIPLHDLLSGNLISMNGKDPTLAKPKKYAKKAKFNLVYKLEQK